MRALYLANLGVAFTIEMWMLWAYAEWGYHATPHALLRWLLALAAPALAGAVWGQWAAPKARKRLSSPWLFLLEWSMFALAAAAMREVGRAHVAVAYLVIASVSVALSAYFHVTRSSSASQQTHT